MSILQWLSIPRIFPSPKFRSRVGFPGAFGGGARRAEGVGGIRSSFVLAKRLLVSLQVEDPWRSSKD